MLGARRAFLDDVAQCSETSGWTMVPERMVGGAVLDRGPDSRPAAREEESVRFAQRSRSGTGPNGKLVKSGRVSTWAMTSKMSSAGRSNSRNESRGSCERAPGEDAKRAGASGKVELDMAAEVGWRRVRGYAEIRVMAGREWTRRGGCARVTADFGWPMQRTASAGLSAGPPAPAAHAPRRVSARQSQAGQMTLRRASVIVAL